MIPTQTQTWDEVLVTQAKDGSPAARELIVDRHRAAVTSHARRMLRNTEDVEDAVQETFVKAFRALDSFDTKRPLAPWLMRICTNCCVDIIRSRRVQHDSLDAHEFSLADEKAEVAAGAENRFLAETLRDAISHLPKQYRETIMLRHYSHMDVEEIAKKLGKPEGTIKSWLFRARAMLKKDLQLVMG